MYVIQWILSFVNLSNQVKHIRLDLEKWVNQVLMCGRLFTLFKITYIKFPVQDIASNHKVLKPGIEPQAWAWMGFAWQAQGLKASPAHHWLSTGEKSESFQKLASRLRWPVSSIKHAFQSRLTKDNGSVTMIVALMQVYRAKDILYSYIYGFLFAAMPSMGTKWHYFHQIPYLGEGVGAGC